MSAAVQPVPPEVGALVPQSHGGAIRHGNPGNKGGRSHPSRVRKLARQLGAKRLHILASIGDGTGEDVRPRDQVAAIRELLRVGMSSSITLDDVKLRLRAQMDVIRARLPHEQAEALIDALSGVWK